MVSLARAPWSPAHEARDRASFGSTIQDSARAFVSGICITSDGHCTPAGPANRGPPGGSPPPGGSVPGICLRATAESTCPANSPLLPGPPSTASERGPVHICRVELPCRHDGPSSWPQGACQDRQPGAPCREGLRAPGALPCGAAGRSRARRDAKALLLGCPGQPTFPKRMPGGSSDQPTRAAPAVGT
jgi:hypothetical protein